jgi:putative hemolysin
MRPRDEIDYVTLDAGLLSAARQAVASRHTRLPVCEPGHGLDRTVGLLHAHDLLAAVLHDPGVSLERLVRPLSRVPDDLAVTELLEAMRDEGRHMALVVDGRGTTVGLVTLEDVLEELVGEIDDDRDRLVVTGRAATFEG